MLPLKFLRPQLLNIFTQDTFVFGDVQLPQESILFVPENESVGDLHFQGRIVRYSPSQNIRQAMLAETQRIGAIRLEAVSGQTNGSITYWNGIDINSRENRPVFFEDLQT